MAIYRINKGNMRDGLRLYSGDVSIVDKVKVKSSMLYT